MTSKTIAGHARCECGDITGICCEWIGPVSETVTIETMPEHLRASHEAARNAGSYPHNGAIRMRVEPSCAALLADDWTNPVEDLHDFGSMR